MNVNTTGDAQMDAFRDERAKMISDTQFQQLIHDILIDGIEPRELADRLQVSRPTILRWHMGRNLPYQTMRAVVARYARDVFGIGESYREA